LLHAHIVNWNFPWKGLFKRPEQPRQYWEK
jgi:hypothetical protein